MGDRRHVGVEVEDPEPATRSEEPRQLWDRPLPTRHVREHGHAEHHVEGTIREGGAQRAALAELHAIAEALLLRELAGHGEERRARVHADRASLRTDPPGELARHDTGAASDVERAVA